MNRGLEIVVSFVLVIGSSTLATSVNADSDNAGRVTKLAVEELEPNPLGIVGSRMGPVQMDFDGIGVFIDGSVPTLYSGLGTVTTSSQGSDWDLCSSIESSDCAPTANKQLSTNSVLGICQSAEEIGCIEDVQISIGSTPRQAMVNLGPIGEETYFSEISSLQVPRGSSPSRWQAPDGTHYLVTAHVFNSFLYLANQWSPASSSGFTLQVKRVSPSATLAPNVPTLYPDRVDPTRNVIGVTVPEFTSLKFLDQTAFTIKVRLPDAVSGWFQARLKDGVIGSTALSGNRTVYEFSGSVAPVIVAGGVVRYADLPPDFFSTNYPNQGFESSKGSSLSFPPGSGTSSLQVYNLWLPYLGERALTTINQWNVRSVSSTVSDSCFSSLKGVTGFLSTNAAAFVGNPPIWDPATGSLDYKVAAPHLDENGNVNVGNYTLSFPVAAAKCLYGSTELPPTVDVTVGEEGIDPNFAAKVGLTESNGWVNFSATGFHYSSPTIKVKLGRASLGIAGNGLLSVKVNKKLTAKAIAKFAGLSVKAGSRVSMRVAASSRTRCAVTGTTLVAKATGKCNVTVTVTPKRGKKSSKTVSVNVTGPPTITRKISATAKAIAEHAKIDVSSGSTIALKIAKSSAKNCKVSRSKIVGIKTGTCRVTVSVTSSAGQISSKNLNLKVT